MPKNYTTLPLHFEGINSEQFKNLFNHHASQDEVSAAEYLSRYQSVLGRHMDRQAKIYLDTLVWVHLRDAALGKGRPEEQALLQCLRAIVGQRKGLCISHLHSLLELGRQTEGSLRVTAALLQELTEGVALATPDELRAWECAQFVHEVTGYPAPPTCEKWTKVGLSHRTDLPWEFLPGNAPEREANRAMKIAVDHLWNASFEQVFEAFNWDTKSKLSFDLGSDVVEQLEAIRRSNRQSGRTFKSDRTPAFQECIAKQLRPIFEELLASHGCSNHSSLLRILEAAHVGFDQNALGHHLGLSRLIVDLYVRTVTADRPLNSNDYVDWAHAGAALPNCDVFITERHLAHQLTRELRADKIFGCEVVTGAVAATRLLTDRFL